MKSKKQSAADAARQLSLLWGSQLVEGRSGLSLKAIVAAAIEIADASGLEALSMRTVAERLGVGTMSLYTHVPGKTELVELMVDSVYGELYPGVETPFEQKGDWQEALRFIARQNWQLYRTHPWLLDVAKGRPVLGPNATLKYEAELRPLDKIGLSEVEMDAVLTLVLTHVEGCARSQALVERTQKESGVSDAEWWVTQAPLLNRLVDPARFPVATRVGTATGQEWAAASNPEFVFSFGLERILSGIFEFIQTKKA